MDTGILVVSSEGHDIQTKEHVLLAKQVGVKSIVVYMNKVDLDKDKELLEITELEIRDILTSSGYDGKNTHFVRGSATCALEGSKKDIGEDSIKSLLEILDTKMPLPTRELNKPFLMDIHHTTPAPVFCEM